MRRKEPTVAHFMTERPATADPGLRLTDARERMFIDNIRHLVVLDEGHLVGVISTRDIALALSRGLDQNTATIADAMSPCPFWCSRGTPISQAAREIEVHGYGCVVVVDNDEVIGVFTTTDALRALRQLATGVPAHPVTTADHLPPEDPSGVRSFRVRRHQPIRTGAMRVFSPAG